MWPLPPIFEMLREGGDIVPEEMVRTFNCGIGMIAIVGPDNLTRFAIDHASAEETYWQIGRIEAGQRGCTVSGPGYSGIGTPTWGGNPEGWSATHHA